MSVPDPASTSRAAHSSAPAGAGSEVDDQADSTYDERPPAQPNPSLNRAARTGRTTEDEDLLVGPPARDSSFIHTDPWRVLRIMGEFVAGFDALADVGPAD